MKRYSLFVLLLAGLTVSVGCFFGGSAPEGPARLVPDSARELIIVDVSESALSHTDLPANLERAVADLEDFGDVRTQATVTLPSGQVTISGGTFNFETVRTALQDGGYSVFTYRKEELWESNAGAHAFALLPDESFLVQGDLDAVVAVLRDASRDSGLLWNDDKGELYKVLDHTGEGLVATASKDCRLVGFAGCQAAAWTFARGERLTVIEGTAAVLFRDQATAASAAGFIEQTINANPLITLTEILTDKEVVTIKADVDREDFARLRFPIELE